MLVGRDSELQVVERLLAAARAGASGALVVSGEAGIGKTSLLRLVESTAGDMQVLRAAGSQSEHNLPFGCLSQLLRPVLPLLTRIPEPQAEALERAFALRDGRPGDRFAVGAATLSVLCRAAEERPLLVVVDDLQWVDWPSLDALLFVARRLFTDSTAMLIGLRSGNEAERASADLPQLPLSGLALSDIAGLVKNREWSGEALAQLHLLTGGNPLAVIEMSGDAQAVTTRLDTGLSPGIAVPNLIAEAFGARVGALSAVAQAALLIAAVGGDLSLTTLAPAFAARGVEMGALAEAERAELITIETDQVVFRHPLLASVVYQTADPADRRDVHRAVADGLGHHDLDRRTWHLSEATIAPDAEVAELLGRAAEAARARGAYKVASARFERSGRLSLDAAARNPLLISAAESAWLGGDPERALLLLREAEGDDDRPPIRARAMALSGIVSARSGSLLSARELLCDAGLALAETDPDASVLVLAEAIYTCFYLGESQRTRDVVHHIEGIARRTTSPASPVIADLASGMGRIMVGDGERGAARVRRGLAASRLSEFVDDPRMLPWLLLGPLWLRESGDTRRLIGEVIEKARASAAVGTLPFLLFHAARDDATTQRWSAAEANFREAIALGEETGQRTDVAFSLAGLVWLLARQGRVDETQALAAQAQSACLASHLHVGRVWLACARGDLDAGRGNHGAALAHYRDQQQLIADLGLEDPDLSPSAEIVECQVRLGLSEEAVLEARRFDESSVAKGQPWARARSHRSLALAGIDPDANFTTALSEHARTPDVYERSRTELAYGAFLRRVRRPSEAREVLRRALAGFDSLTATPWAEMAATELTAAGERVHTRPAGQTQPLTPQELQVGLMLAGGRTTREAAAALFLSPKTVEYHLRHVYIKLGISSRRELSERLDRQADSNDDPNEVVEPRVD